MNVIRAILLLACLAAPSLLFAGNGADQVEAGVDAALLHLAERGALGRFDQPLTISRPAQVRYELGAVVDVRKPDPRGLEVLAITPGGAAARMGLKAGDRLVAINGRRLDGNGAPASLLLDAVRDGHGAVQLLTTRGKSRMELAGQADAAAVPAYRLTIGEAAPAAGGGCGYVSYSATPPGSQGLFETLITRIDGRSTPPRINLLRVPAGRHVLTLQELVPEHRLSASQNLQRRLMQRQSMMRAYKSLVVDVKPDTDYRVAARLHKGKLDRASIRANEYWEPVVWAQRSIRCR
ncbi:PDZ domain-containing protein [Luteimonas notoginsengisoli]|uniref:PDZ domain-containing protein n=1 Tax=Luteimonas notoginsengisoli TaxID=1578200 RepID=A0ABV7URB6_9GAMM